jgi:hypothetical protein
LIFESKKKDRLTAISPKSGQVPGSGGCDCSGVLPLPASREHIQRAEATGEKLNTDTTLQQAFNMERPTTLGCCGSND